MVTYESTFEAYFDCRRNKRNTANALEYEVCFEDVLIRLTDSINARSYTPSRSIAFVVTRPRYREVFAADFVDRVLHHWIVLRIEPLLEQTFSPRTFNCRKGKGTMAAVRQLKEDIMDCSEHYTKDCWVATADMRSFFMSIPKRRLADIVDQFIVDNYEGDDKEDLRWLTEMYIMHCPENNCVLKSPEEMWNMFPHSKSLRYGDGTHGEPIGNLISQILANYYLNEFDWMLESEFGFRYHGRYVDDFYIVSRDNRKILAAMPAIRAYLAGIGITLHPCKFYCQHYTKGVRFVGNIVKADRVYVLNRTVNGLREAIERLNTNAKKAANASETRCDETVWCGGVAGLMEKDVSSVNSYLGFMRHCNSYAVRRRILTSISDDGYKVVSVGGRFEYIMFKGRYRRRRAMMDALKRRDYDSVFPLIKCDTQR